MIEYIRSLLYRDQVIAGRRDESPTQGRWEKSERTNDLREMSKTGVKCDG